MCETLRGNFGYGVSRRVFAVGTPVVAGEHPCVLLVSPGR